MNFVHFSAQNTSVKVEISNQVKCHTAQRSEARGGRAGPEAGRKMSRPSLKPQSTRAREVEGRPWGAGGSAPLQGSQELLLAGRGPGEGVGKMCHQRVLPRAPSVGRRPANALRGALLGPATLPASRARKGLAALSCLVSPPRGFL